MGTMVEMADVSKSYRRGDRRISVLTGIDLAIEEGIAVGTLIAERPPHRSERARFGHSAPTLGG
ncbi:MAG: hypothetical protein ACREVY_15135 [Gammaproteobacteria bacterium]